MTANEIRIGNWVFYECTVDDEKPYQVNGADICMYEDLKDRYEPIPLTEEWLLKFGFEKFEHGYKFNNFTIEETDYGICLYEEQHLIKNQIKWVHQLQNLYFALTNEELIVK